MNVAAGNIICPLGSIVPWRCGLSDWAGCGRRPYPDASFGEEVRPWILGHAKSAWRVNRRVSSSCFAEAGTRIVGSSPAAARSPPEGSALCAHATTPLGGQIVGVSAPEKPWRGTELRAVCRFKSASFLPVPAFLAFFSGAPGPRRTDRVFLVCPGSVRPAAVCPKSRGPSERLLAQLRRASHDFSDQIMRIDEPPVYDVPPDPDEIRQWTGQRRSQRRNGTREASRMPGKAGRSRHDPGPQEVIRSRPSPSSTTWRTCGTTIIHIAFLLVAGMLVAIPLAPYILRLVNSLCAGTGSIRIPFFESFISPAWLSITMRIVFWGVC